MAWWSWIDDLVESVGMRLVGVFDLWGAPRPSRDVEVPDLLGLLPDDARLSALHAGVRLQMERLEPDPAPSAGIVVRQSPVAGRAYHGRAA